MSKNHLLQPALDAESAEAESGDAAVDVNKVFPRKFAKGGSEEGRDQWER
jgi:hypothetical protein